MALSLSACGDSVRDPLERKVAHGHIDGATNELVVGGTRLRFSPDIDYSPDTNGPIIDGFADTVYLVLRYPELHASAVVNTVYITVRGGWKEIPNVWNSYIQEEDWRSVNFDEALGLVKYERQRFDGGWGFITFITPEQSQQSQMPDSILTGFRCSSGVRDLASGTCMGSFAVNSDLRVEYKIHGSMMEHWKVIHADVVNLISTVVVN